MSGVTVIRKDGEAAFTGGYITGGTINSGGIMGGVRFEEGGSLTMNGGTIIGNTTNNPGYGGGGVFMYNADAEFHMNAGGIIGNTAANGWGGGIYLNLGAAFDMSGGVIEKDYAVKASNDGSGAFSAFRRSVFSFGNASNRHEQRGRLLPSPLRLYVYILLLF